MRIGVSKRAERKADIKAKAQEVIYARYPQWKQSNLLAEGDAVAIGQAWGWIDSVREHSNALEALVDAGQVANLESGWPA